MNDKLAIRSWNNTPISRRTTDGYVNATAMAKANGKQWSHYRETERANTYIEALSRNTEIRVTDLYIAKRWLIKAIDAIKSQLSSNEEP